MTQAQSVASEVEVAVDPSGAAHVPGADVYVAADAEGYAWRFSQARPTQP